MTTAFLSELEKVLGPFSNPDGACGYFGENPGQGDDENALIAFYLPDGAEALQDPDREFTTALIIGVAVLPSCGVQSASTFILLLVAAIKAAIAVAYPEGLPQGCPHPWVQYADENDCVITWSAVDDLTYAEVLSQLRGDSEESLIMDLPGIRTTIQDSPH